MENEILYNPGYEATRWVGYFDLLGIKEKIKDNNTIAIFNAYSSALEELEKRKEPFDGVKYAWFSDTFLIYTANDSVESFCEIDNVSRWFFSSLIADGIPVRGSISCSSFYADSDCSLFFGRALLEAYEYGEAQDWIGYVLCPSAVLQLSKLKVSKSLLNYACVDIPYNERCSGLTRKLPASILGRWLPFDGYSRCIKNLETMRDECDHDGVRKKYDRAIALIEANRRV